MSFKQLHETVERIHRMLRDANYAHNFPNQFYSDAERVSVGNSAYGHPSAETLDAAKALKERLLAEFRAKGEDKRDCTLDAIAQEIESLRVLLPSMAAAACIDLGARARAGFPPEKDT